MTNVIAVEKKINRMMQILKVTETSQLADFLGLKSANSVRKWTTVTDKGLLRDVPEKHLMTFVIKKNANYDWLLTGEGEMHNCSEKTAPTISEVPDETRDGYQTHPDGAALFDRVELRLEQAEIVMLSDTQYAQELEELIKKLYNLHRQESRKKSESSGR